MNKENNKRINEYSKREMIRNMYWTQRHINKRNNKWTHNTIIQQTNKRYKKWTNTITPPKNFKLYFNSFLLIVPINLVQELNENGSDFII